MTDANVVVGHLPPRLIGGEMALDVEPRAAAVQTIADAMGLSLDAAAEGILAIVNENMAGALRRRSPCSAATTRASSRSSPSAAPARCTPTRSPS